MVIPQIIAHLNSVKKTYKCPDCSIKFGEQQELYSHFENSHFNNIPKGTTLKQYIFNRKYKKEYSLCVICRTMKTQWNEETCRYNRYCSDECKQKAIKVAKENMVKTYGKDHLLNDPDIQRKMLESRKISGKYIFTDKTEMPYVGTYELDFLQYYDKELNLSSKDIMPCPYIFRYMYKDVEHFYMPDFFINSLNLIVEIKDGGDNPNNHPNFDREREATKDKTILESKSYNFIKIKNKNYYSFYAMLTYFRSMNLADKNVHSDDVIVIL